MMELCDGSQRGGFNSLASQPNASVFMGSTAKDIFSVRWQVLHSKVRSSKPRGPGEIRASPILCLQVGQDGRSSIEEELRITPRSRKNDRGTSKTQSVRYQTLCKDFVDAVASRLHPGGSAAG